jgi:hypothetical protein
MAESNIIENCGACKFFTNGDILGTCVRFPQGVNKHETNWCGEFNQLVVAKKRGRPYAKANG